MLNIFLTLSSRRQSGMGPCPISDEAVTSYCDRHGIYRLDTREDIDIFIQELDAIWMEHAQTKMKANSR